MVKFGGHVEAFRQGDLKAVSVKGRPWELYDLAVDRSELNDLASSRPQDLEVLTNRWYEVAEKTEQAPSNLRRPVAVSGKQNKKQQSQNMKKAKPN